MPQRPWCVVLGLEERRRGDQNKKIGGVRDDSGINSTPSEQQDAGMVAGATTCDKRLPTDLRLAFTNHKLRYEPEVALGRSETW